MTWRLPRSGMRWPPQWPRRRWRAAWLARRWPRWRWPSRRLHRPLAAALALLVLALLWATHRPEPSRPAWQRADILTAIRFVESGGRDDVPDGDGGLAIGPFQIHEVYWRDAVANDPSLGGSYQDCRRRGYAERVLAAYMAKWCRDAWDAGDAEVIARVHNGGPGGADKPSTLAYWERVRARLP